MKTDRNTLKKAVYQYLLDHTYPTKKGTVVNFLLPKEKEFYGKIKSRETGKYIRKTEETIIDEMFDYRRLQKAENYNKWKQKRLNKLKKDGGFLLRCVIKVREKLNRFVNSKL